MQTEKRVNRLAIIILLFVGFVIAFMLNREGNPLADFDLSLEVALGLGAGAFGYSLPTLCVAGLVTWIAHRKRSLPKSLMFSLVFVGLMVVEFVWIKVR